MRTPFFQMLVDEQITEAVFFTLLHSLWIGAIVAALAALVIQLTRNSRPGVRYQLLSSLLLVFMLAEILVFRYEFNLKIEPAQVSGYTEGNEKVKSISAYLTSSEQGIPKISQLMTFIKSNAAIFVVLWFAVMSWKSIQLIMGFNQLSRLKHLHISNAGIRWNNRLTTLCESLYIKQKIRLYLSAIISVPMVIGIMKPVILFPVAMFNALSTEEVEAILLHELAHIKRQDFLINMLQRFTEIIFFFNPAVYWVSEQIRRERENCCDDLAISVTHDKKQFIYALVAFQEHHLQQDGIQLATAFPGEKNHVFHRINRILTNRNKSLNAMEKLTLASAILVTCIATIAFSQQNPEGTKQELLENKHGIPLFAKQEPQQEKNTLQSPVQQKNIGENTLTEGLLVKDTLPEKVKVKHSTTILYTTTIAGKVYELSRLDGKITALKIDGKEIPVSQFSNHQAAIDSIDRRTERDNELLEMEHMKLALHSEHMLREQEALLEKSMLFKENELFKSENQRLLADQLYNQQFILKEQLNHMKIKEELLKKEMPELLKNGKLLAEEHLFNEKHLFNQLVEEKMALQEHQLALKGHESALMEQALAEKSQSEIIEMIDELYAEGFIKDKRNLKVKLNNKELIINGKKQPAELHDKILKRFSKKPGDNINFEYNITN